MRIRSLSLGFALMAVLGQAHTQVVLKNGADVDMTGSTGSQIVFPDGTNQSTAAGSDPVPGHGGTNNSLSGLDAFIGGGRGNAVAGQYTVINGGRNAKIAAEHDGASLISDGAIYDFNSAGANEFAVRATGGVRLVSGIDEDNFGVPNAGVSLAADASAWGTISARDAKENFTDIDPVAILEKLAALPIQQWNYKAHDPSVKQIGPIAEEFKAAFGLNGPYDGTITTLEIDGVALAAIQGVNAKLERELAEERLRNDALEARLPAE